MFNESKNIICKTEATKNNLNEEPIILDSRKKKNLFYKEKNPNLLSKYVYIDTRFSL